LNIAAFRPFLLSILFASSLVGCYSVRPSNGGGQTSFDGTRLIKPADIALPAGYRIVPVASGFTFPTGVAVDESGDIYVVESGYFYGEVFTTPKLIKVSADGSKTTIASGTRNGPWNGVAYANGAFYVAEGGELEGGRILRIAKDGKISVLVSELPSMGDHHTNGPVIGPDGALYFAQGTATNSGVVGEDNAKFGWLKRYPNFHDTPCQLYTAFSTVPKRVAKPPLAPNDGKLAEANAMCPMWKPGHWSVDQAARCLLLLAYDASDTDRYVSIVEMLFSTADARELIALYQSLPLLPHQERYIPRAAEGVRSNMVNVFHAMALNNSYPFEWFDEPAWNQMVLKVAFIGSPMREIIGLDVRANPALARMLRDLVHERRAAGRGFPAEVWQLMAPYAEEEMMKDFYLALEDGDESQRAAAAAALAKIDHRIGQ
jgi:hypothetical protein